MAKKKKPAANPARGFATTSIPSKSKVDNQQQQQQDKETDSDAANTASLPSRSKLSDTAKLDETTSAHIERSTETNSANTARPHETTSANANPDQAPESSTNNPSNPSSGSEDKTHASTEKELKDLTPDELQARLEDAELQALVDKHSARSARDATRTVDRLRAERRVYRSHGSAKTLSVRRLLGEELVERVLALAREEVNAGGMAFVSSFLGGNVRAGRKRKADGSSEEESVARAWTLQRALLALGFAEDHVLRALEYALRYVPRGGSGGGVVWGLDECLDWLVLNLDESEIPDLDRLHAEKAAKGGPLDGNSETPTPLESSEQSEAEDVEQAPPALPRAARERLTDVSDAEASGGNPVLEDEGPDVSDVESDLEPDELLSSYLRAKTRLFELQPELVEARPQKGKPNKQRPIPKSTPESPTAKKLQEKIRRIESDLLFDGQKAEEQWVYRRNQIAQDAAERRKLGLSQPSTPSVKGKEESDRAERKPDDRPENQAANVSDDEEAFGGLFESTAGNERDERAAADGQGGGNITILDFGRATGVSPRRILEEACRARDSRAQLNYKIVSQAAFSVRHSLTIKWSKNQMIAFPLDMKSATSITQADTCTFTMNSIATPDTRQSESYVSVVALFQIFSTSAKEEKVYLRLPAAWRDLWFEFVAQRKADVDLEEKNNLRRLRDLYNAANEEQNMDENDATESSKDHSNPQSKNAASNDEAPHVNGDTAAPDGQRLQEIWRSKSSTPSYQNMLQGRMELPIHQFREAALSAIEQHSVTIICGETGCGKSTQMPAFILERELQQGKGCKIYCTEPRRISAITLAQRVSQELGEAKSDLGTARSLIGYAIRLESQVSAATRLVYATTGIVLRMLESKDGLKDVTHLVIDEVHERSIETDFLLIILRTLLKKGPDLKLILMSATVDAERFSKYFEGAPILNVPGRTFPVETKFLEDALEVTGHVIDDNTYVDESDDELDTDGQNMTAKEKQEAESLAQYSQQTRQTLKKINEYRIDYNLILNLITRLCSDVQFQSYSKAILVFLPGIGEIRQLSDMIHGTPLAKQCVIHALHSAIPSEDQQRAFQPPPKGMKKIVISTNIAETGVTIPDVTCVIDTGKHKEMRFDERRQISRLIESFISRANAKQRRGRAGRVQAGLCFHLFTRSRHDTAMAEEQTPEMLRLSLQDLVMRVKICKLGDIQTALASALDPPSAKNVRRAIDALTEVGALTPKEDLTPLGRQLAKLPLDPYLGKLILLGALFGSLDIALTLAAILTSKSPFVTPINGRQQAAAARAAFAKADSDLITDFNAYASWRRICSNSPSAEASFCRRNFLSAQTLANIEDLKAQLLSSLAETGLVTLTPAERAAASRISNSSSGGGRARRFTPTPAAHAAHAENTDLACGLIACAFYPKLLARGDPLSATGVGHTSGGSSSSKSNASNKSWRNVATNQAVSLHPASILRSAPSATATASSIPFLSFYSIMQGSAGARRYNASSLTPAPPLFLALLAGSGSGSGSSGADEGGSSSSSSLSSLHAEDDEGMGMGSGGVFHDVAQVLSLDAARRVRFAVEDEGRGAGGRWKAYVAVKFLRRRVRGFVVRRWAGLGYRAQGQTQGQGVEERLGAWMAIWEAVVERVSAGSL